MSAQTPILDYGYAGTGAWIKFMGADVCDETRWCLIAVYVFLCAVGLFVYGNYTAYNKAADEDKLRSKKAEAKFAAAEPAGTDEWTKMD
eukprot:SAG22_NODE_10190_length_548_cov_1.153675_2_plen_89_part_00